MEAIGDIEIPKFEGFYSYEAAKKHYKAAQTAVRDARRNERARRQQASVPPLQVAPPPPPANNRLVDIFE